MAIRTETNTITVVTQVVTISADEYRLVNQKSWTIFGIGACLMATSITFDHFIDDAKSSLGLYLFLLFAVFFGFLLLYGSMWYKDRAHKKIAVKNGWDGKSRFRVEADDEQSFMHA